jgi:uncharacterized repeat protein (TIGR01451 family)
MCRRVAAGLKRWLPVALSLVLAVPAFAQNPGLGSVDCSDVQANAQVTVVDPEGDVAGNGGTCPNPVNYGFDYGQVSIWYDQDGTGDLYFCVGTHGNIGDSDQDGGFHTESAVCGGRPDCVNQEGDPFGNVFASGIEQITWAFDRDCDGFTDLLFTLTGSNSSRADSVRVSIDVLTNHVNDILGGRGVAWEGENVQRNADVICDVDREGAVIIRIQDWRQYFTTDGTEGGDILPGLSPNLFQWIVDGGNNADQYNEDVVDGNFNETDPRIQIEKTADPTTLCGIGDETTITLTVTNTGDEVLTDVAVADTLPVGLAYVAGSASLAPTSVVGQVITWSGLTLQPAEVLVITFDAEKTADCDGEVINIATVEATFNPLCFEALNLDPVTLTDDDTFPIDCVGADVEVVLTDGISSCVGEPVNVPGTVTNNSTEVSDITVTPYINGIAGVPLVYDNVPPGGVRNFNILVSCATPGSVTVRADAVAAVDGSPDCTDTDSDETTVVCEEACVEFSVPARDTTLCVGDQVTIPFTIRNCATSAESLVVTVTIGGNEEAPQTYPNVAGGGTVVVNVPVTCEDGGSVLVEVDVEGFLRSNPDCSDEASDNATVTCLDSDIEIEKTTTQAEGDSCATVTITVTNTGDSVLDPVVISDCFPDGLTFDETQTIGGTCEAVLDDVVPGAPGFSCIFFEPIALDPDESCTITYELCCVANDNSTQIDTASVEAWCRGSFGIPGIEPVTDSDTAAVVCRGEGEACPHTIGFWRQQCAQKGNGSTKICLEGMENLWRCVIEETDVIQWKKNDGSFETTASLAALSDANLFTALCSQLNGPRPMTIRDMTEIQYLGLMLNVCSGALPLDILIANGFNGTVGAAIDSIENALNTGQNLGFWSGIADDINNRIGVEAADCVNGDSLFRNQPGCEVPDAAPGDLDGSGFSFGSDQLATRAFPNPVQKGGTTIAYAVPSTMSGTHVEIAVFDLTGRLVKRLVSEEKSPGQYTVDWDLRDEGGSSVSSGIFFYRVKAGAEVVTQKLIIMQ